VRLPCRRIIPRFRFLTIRPLLSAREIIEVSVGDLSYVKMISRDDDKALPDLFWS
jgi:hypothetical protein